MKTLITAVQELKELVGMAEWFDKKHTFYYYLFGKNEKNSPEGWYLYEYYASFRTAYFTALSAMDFEPKFNTKLTDFIILSGVDMENGKYLANIYSMEV